VKLGFHAAEKAHAANWLPFAVPHLTEAIFWSGLGLIVTLGGIFAFRNQAKPDAETETDVEMMTDAQDLYINSTVRSSAQTLATDESSAKGSDRDG
jgi:uncharacterized membrane protein